MCCGLLEGGLGVVDGLRHGSIWLVGRWVMMNSFIFHGGISSSVSLDWFYSSGLNW